MLFPRALAILSSSIGSSLEQFVAALPSAIELPFATEWIARTQAPGTFEKKRAAQRQGYSGPKKEIIAALTAKPHALQVAHDTGWSFATLWRRADSAGIELTVGRGPKAIDGSRLIGGPKSRKRGGQTRRRRRKRWRAPPRSTPTASRIERGDRRGAGAPA